MNSVNAGKARQRLMLLVLVLIFAAPLITAWLLLHFTDIGRAGGSSHGHLVQPPRVLADIALRDPATGAQTDRLRGKWTLLYLSRPACRQPCADNLYRMRQLRLAMGENAHRVRRLLAVYGGALDDASRRILEQYPGQLIVDGTELDRDDPGASFRLAPGEDPVGAGRLYLIDPLGNLMMSYAPDTDPVGIIADLRRLLKYSHIG